MSDSGSETGSSSGNSAVSYRLSTHEGEGIEQEEKACADIREQEGLANTTDAKDEDPKSKSITAPTRDTDDEDMHILWQDLGSEDTANDQTTENRLIDFVIVPGAYPGEGKEDDVLSPESRSPTWVIKYAKEGSGTQGNHQNSCRVLRFDYNFSELLSSHRTREVIKKLGVRLLSGLNSKRCNEAKKRMIFFISHDIGGTIVKDALVTASLDINSWQDISQMTRVLIFNSCPHRQKDKTDLETRLAWFLYRNHKNALGKPRPSTSSISGLAKAVLQVNGLFIASHLGLRNWVINLHSYGEESDGGFDAYCACLGIPLEKRFVAPVDEDHSILTEYLTKVESDLRDPQEFVVADRQYTQERKLLALASPIYPLRTHVEPNPLSNLPAYQSWLKSPSPQILYIHGNHGVRDVVEKIFYGLEKEAETAIRRANVLYFSFDKYDVRADSIRDMIATFLAQICNHHPKLGPAINRLCSQIENERGWTETDLIQFFEMFRISAEVEQTMIVINHFDECTKGSRKNFLDHITSKYYNDETPWKIVVTSHEPGALNEELSGPFCVPIDISTGELGNPIGDCFEAEVQALLSSRGDPFSQEGEIPHNLGFIEQLESPVRQIICEQLRVREEWPDETTTDDLFGSLNLTQQPSKSRKAMVSVLHTVLSLYPEQDSLECLFSWLLYSVRPLTIWELATVFSFSDKRESCRVSPSFTAVDQLVYKIEKDLAGILEVDHNEIRFKHPCFHDIMINSDYSVQSGDARDYLWNRIKDKSHNLIQRMCLEYLSRDVVQDYVRKTFEVTDSATFETPPFPDRTNLASYSIQAWTYHYSLSIPLPSLSDLSSQKDFVQTLAKAHWCLSNPATKRSPCYQSLFPVFAGLGLHQAVQPRGSDDTQRGLIEAASKGQCHVVDELLREYEFTPEELWKVLEAASSSGVEELMTSLLSKIETKGEIAKDFDWPPVLIYRAANLGLEAFAERILTLGSSPDPNVEWRNETSMYASPLYLAACHGHTGTVSVLLKYGASMEFTSLRGRNPLHKAALEGHTKTVETILDKTQVEIDCTAESKHTPLYLAVLGGNHVTAKLLLDKGADPNMGIRATSTGDDQWTPLITATDDGFRKSIKLLLDKDADPNIPGPSGPPLFWAVSRGRVDVLDMLLEYGADPRSGLLQKPLIATAVTGIEDNKGSLDVLEKLLKLGLDVNEKISDGYTALTLALALCGKKEDSKSTVSDTDRPSFKAVKMLLSYDADPNLHCDGMGTPLQYALMARSYNLVQMLLKKGAIADTVSGFDQEPLLLASDQPDIARLLLENRADPDIACRNGFSPLTYAACFGHLEAVKTLLEFGATVDLPFGTRVANPLNEWLTGWSPLMVAAFRGHNEIVRILAEAGSDLKFSDSDESSQPVLHLASTGGTIQTLLEFPSRIDLNVQDSDKLGLLHFTDMSFEDFKRLVNAGADIELQGSTGFTPLYVHAGLDLEKAKLLVQRGANVNHPYPGRGSPLHRACKERKLDTIKFLVEHGADIGSVDEYWGTPLQALCMPQGPFDPTEHETMVRYLVSEYDKQNVDMAQKAGIWGYAISSAAFGSTPAVINLLLEKIEVTVDVSDDMGRMPIHFAACNGLANFEVIREQGGDVFAKDKQGRTPLHWAVQTGRLEVVQKIISLMEDMSTIDEPDIDGWTPLCWAPRGGLRSPEEESMGELSRSEEVIKLLIDKHADKGVDVKQGKNTWNPLSIAHYHQRAPDIVALLANDDTDSKAEEERNKEVDRFKKGVEWVGSCCDYCLSKIYGVYWSCNSCDFICFCFKCYERIDMLHDPHHEFTRGGEEEYEDEGTDGSGNAPSGSSDIYSDSRSDSDASEVASQEDDS